MSEITVVASLLPVIAKDAHARSAVECSVWSALLPVVAERVHAGELLDRDLGLARSVGAHQAGVLAGLERALGKDDFAPGRHRDDHVCAECLLTRGDIDAELGCDPQRA